jgi:hypothetical protein
MSDVTELVSSSIGVSRYIGRANTCTPYITSMYGIVPSIANRYPEQRDILLHCLVLTLPHERSYLVMSREHYTKVVLVTSLSITRCLEN